MGIPKFVISAAKAARNTAKRLKYGFKGHHYPDSGYYYNVRGMPVARLHNNKMQYLKKKEKGLPEWVNVPKTMYPANLGTRYKEGFYNLEIYRSKTHTPLEPLKRLNTILKVEKGNSKGGRRTRKR